MNGHQSWKFLPKNALFNLHLSTTEGSFVYRSSFMFGISFLKFTLWISYGSSYKKTKYGTYRRVFEICLSNYYRYECYTFIEI